MSKQQTLILKELQKSKFHPTADELYHLIRKKMPRISLGTVYRNLNVLAERGEILKLNHGNEPARFDGNIENHYHFHCCACGKVYDILIDLKDFLQQSSKNIKEHQVKECQLEFCGYCSNCKKEVRNGKDS